MMSRGSIPLWLVLAMVLFPPPGGSAQTSAPEEPTPQSSGEEEPPGGQEYLYRVENPTLTRGWFGLAPTLARHGVGFEVFYTADFFSNVSGGLDTGTVFLDQLDLMLRLESQPLVGYPNGTLFLMTRGNHGGYPTRNLVGDYQFVNNIEPFFDQFILYEAWYEHRFFDGRFSLKVGLYDTNTEFDVNETGSVFLHAAHGIGTDFGQSGTNGPSIFPIPGVGIRAEARATDDLAFRLLVADGSPGDDPGENARNPLVLRQSEGALIVAEGSLDWKLGGFDGRLTAGYWMYTAAFETVLNPDPQNPDEDRGNLGFYALLESTLIRENDRDDQGLRAFIRWGLANDRFNLFGQYLGTGVVYKGLIPSRDSDHLGIGMAAAFTGTDSIRAAEQEGLDVGDYEISFELTYRAKIAPGLYVHPDVQYVINPGIGLRGAAGHATTVGIRFELNF
jgi:porin